MAMHNSTDAYSEANGTRLDRGGSYKPTVYYGFFALLVPSVLANLLAMFIFGRSVRRKGPIVNYFLLALSCTDFLGCLFAVLAIFFPLFVHVFTPAVCNFTAFIGTFCGLLSALLAGLLAVDRFVALCKPYAYGEIFNRKKAWVYICIAITLSSFVCCLNSIGLGISYTYVGPPGDSRAIVCTFRVYQEDPRRRVFGYVYGLFGSCVLIVVVVCNVQVILAVMKMRRSVLTIGAIANREESTVVNPMRSELKFVRAIGGLSVCCLMCWGPYMMNAWLTQMKVEFNQTYLAASTILVTCNFIVDPFVFLLLKKSYRQEVAGIMRVCCPRVGASDGASRSTNTSSIHQLKDQPIPHGTA